MAFVKHTANPKNETNDCIVRSIANATGRPWQDVMRELCDIAIELCLMPNDSEVVDEYMYRRQTYVYNPEVTLTMNKNGNVTVEEFASQNPDGRFVLCCQGHGVSLINGDWYDLTDCAKDVVVEYYKVKEEV